MLAVGTMDGVFLVEPEAPTRSTTLSKLAVYTVRSAGEHLIAGTADGVYRSSDRGHSWRRVGLEGCEVLAVEVSPWDVDILLASTRPPALCRSTDRGASWSPVKSLNAAPGAETWSVPHVPGGAPSGFRRGARAHTIAFDPFDPDRLWIGVEVGALAGTDDSGGSWWSVVPGNNPDVHAVVPDPARKGRLYLSAGFGRL